MIATSDLSVALAALRLLAVDHPNLPAPDVTISPIFPTQLTLSLHRSFGDFEAWREALRIDPADVTRRTQSSDTTAVLKASATVAGATVEIVGYGPNLLVADARPLAAVAA